MAKKKKQVASAWSPLPIFNWLLIGMGTAVIIAGILVHFQSTIPANYRKTTGTVYATTTKIVKYVCGGSSPSCSSHRVSYFAAYYAQISFDVNGRTYLFSDYIGDANYDLKTGVSTNRQGASYPDGRQVTVAYDPSDPGSRPINADYNKNAYVDIIAGVIGAVMVVSGVVLLRVKARRKN